MPLTIIETILNENILNPEEVDISNVKNIEFDSQECSYVNTFHFLKPDQTYHYYKLPRKDKSGHYMIAYNQENSTVYVCEQVSYSLGSRVLLLGQYEQTSQGITHVNCCEQSGYNRLYRF